MVNIVHLLVHRCPPNPTPHTAISAYACMPFHLTPTFWTKIFLVTRKMVFFCCAFLRQETVFSCKLLTGSPRTMQLQLKRNLSPLLSLSCLFSISNTGGYYHHFPKFRWFPYYFNKGGGESKWIMMTAVIQTDCVIFCAVCLGLVRWGITSVKQLWIWVLNI